jgi:paraquat-inducible protein A
VGGSDIAAHIQSLTALQGVNIPRHMQSVSPDGRQTGSSVIACPGCDLLQRIPPFRPGGKARCPRCGDIVATRPSKPLERTLALAVAAVIAFIVANMEPLMRLSAGGRRARTTIIGSAYEMWLQGHEFTASVVAFCSVIAPASYILFILTVLLALRRPPAPHWVAVLMRWASFMRPWSMQEVMLLGILVSLSKIADLATVIPGVGMYAVGILVVLLVEITVTFDSREVWKRVEWASGELPQPRSDARFGAGAAR